MCFRKKKMPFEPAEHRLLTFGRNVYSQAPLRGCVNDTFILADSFKKPMPNLTVNRFIDFDATCKNYLERGAEAIALLPAGATVVVIMDSCFSGTATRGAENYKQARFISPNIPMPKGKVHRVARPQADMKWLAISACLDFQSAYDAKIGNEYYGAFSYFASKSLRIGMTWMEWVDRIQTYLPSDMFDQQPMIEGPEHLRNRYIGDGPTLIIHNSSHGSWMPDDDGDEDDGRDEGLYFDRFLRDDRINDMLLKIVS